jgi:hypothetical protein
MQRNSTGAVRAYVGMSVPDTWLAQSGIEFDKPDLVRAKLLAHFADWNTKALDFIRNCDDDFMVPRPLYALPISPKGTLSLFSPFLVSPPLLLYSHHCAEEEEREKEGKWPKHHDGVTLLGDAAHVTGPSGKGVNYAMLDALELANGLIGMIKEEKEKEGEKERIAVVVREFQKELFVRSREAISSAEKIMNLKYGPDAPGGFVSAIKKAHSG